MFSFLFLLFLPPSFPLENRKKKTIGIKYAHLALTFFSFFQLCQIKTSTCSSPCMLHQGNRKFKNFRPPKPQLINRKHIWQTTRSAGSSCTKGRLVSPQVSLRKIAGIQFASLKKPIVKNQTPVNDIMNKADYQIQ